MISVVLSLFNTGILFQNEVKNERMSPLISPVQKLDKISNLFTKQYSKLCEPITQKAYRKYQRFCWKLTHTKKLWKEFILGDKCLTICQIKSTVFWGKMDLPRVNIDDREFFLICFPFESSRSKYWVNISSARNMTWKKCEMKFDKVNSRCVRVERVLVWILIVYQSMHNFVCIGSERLRVSNIHSRSNNGFNTNFKDSCKNKREKIVLLQYFPLRIRVCIFFILYGKSKDIFTCTKSLIWTLTLSTSNAYNVRFTLHEIPSSKWSTYV